MRKIDVFGRKINQTRPFYFIILIFALVIPLHFLILNLQETQLEELRASELLLQAQIQELVDSSETPDYHAIDEIIAYLPADFNQSLLENELNLVRNLAGLSLATGYEMTVNDNMPSPLETEMPSTLRFVKITISMTTEEPNLIFDYLDLLLEQDRIFYVDEMRATYLDGNAAQFILTLYTFYNNVDLS